MSNTSDLRFKRTEKMLKEAFLELMEKGGFQRITIEELTQKAFISRKTFYLHYLDKYDMLNHIEEELLNGIGQIIKPIPDMIKSAGYRMDEAAEQQHLKLYIYLKEHAYLIRLLLSEKGDPVFINKIEGKIRTTFEGGYPGSIWRIPASYLASLFAAANAGIIQEWVSGGTKETVDELARITTIIVQGYIDNCKK